MRIDYLLIIILYRLLSLIVFDSHRSEFKRSILPRRDDFN